jgi:hypothetical protein
MAEVNSCSSQLRCAACILAIESGEQESDAGNNLTARQGAWRHRAISLAHLSVHSEQALQCGVEAATPHLVIRCSRVAERSDVASVGWTTPDTCRRKAAPCCKSWLDLCIDIDRRVRDGVAAAARGFVCDCGNGTALAMLFSAAWFL